ncbi:MAG: hypothetical protein JW816_03020 [Candidatus Buchananbacteria bacterium]|nr:hypothetical protein [Candidatus Buchananbacteria bacterium]
MFKGKFLKKSWGLLVLGLFLIALPVTVLAANQNDSVYVAADQIIDGNLIKFGNVIDIAGAVKGDLIVFGNTITISGPVAGDVIAAGNVIKITGDVNGSVRVAGSNVDIDGNVGHNAWVVAGNVNFGDQSSVGWDLYSSGGSVTVKGDVDGNLAAAGGNIIIANKVGKDVSLEVGKDGQIILYPTAKLAGDLNYKADKDSQLVLQDGAQVAGETSRKAIPVASGQEAQKAFYAAFAVGKLIALFGLLVVGLLLVSLAPKFMVRVNDKMMQKPGASIGWGVIFFFLTPIAVFVLAITLIGLPLALILIPLWLIALYLSKMVVGFVVGWWLFVKLSKGKYQGNLVWPLIIGLLVVVIVGSIPVIGWLIMLVAIWWALGGVLQVKKEIIKELQ